MRPARTTLATRTARPGSRRDRAVLHHGQRLTSIESGRSSRVGVLVGQGGFGQVLLATRLGSADHVPTTVCIKASTRQDGWLREAHFERLREKGVRIAVLSEAQFRRLAAARR